MKTIFAYLRDSGGPAQERSVPEQRQALQAWSDEQGYLIARWYVDAARSGTNEERPEFQRLIAEALKAKPHAVAVWDSPVSPATRTPPSSTAPCCAAPAWPSSPSTTTFLTARWPALSNR